MATARQLSRLIDPETLEAILPSQGVRSRVLNCVRVAVQSAKEVPNEALTDGMLLELYRESMRDLSGSLSVIRGMGEMGLTGVEEYLIQRELIADDLYKRILSIKGKGLNARIHVAIPREDLGKREYRTWVDREVITPWLVDQEKNPRRVVRETKWNEIVYISPKIKGIGRQVGISKRDGNFLPVVYDHSVGPRGVYIEQGFTLEMVERVHFVANSLEATLKRKGITYERHNRG